MTQRITMAALLKIELPSRTVLLTDSGMLPVGSEIYRQRDDLLGSLAGFEPLNEGVGEEAPAASLTFLPPDTTASSAINSASLRGSRVRLWLVEVNAETGLPIGTPEQQADWIIDYTIVTVGMNRRELEFVCSSGGDRLFQIKRGNSLSPAFHKSVHPGETGLDNASGVTTSVPWGAPSAPRGVTGSSGSYGGMGAIGGGGSMVTGV